MKEAPLLDHLEELRRRIIFSVLSWVIAAGVAFYFRTDLLMWLQHPLNVFNEKSNLVGQLVFFNLTEPILTGFKIAGFGGLVLALPFIVFQIWAFISPGLYARERRLAIPFLLGAGFSFAAGVAFAYYLMLPVAIPFMLGFLGAVAVPQISIGQYMGQVITLMSMMGLVFEMPVLAFLGAQLGFVSAKFLLEQWRIALVAILVISALITPTPDPFNMMIVALPLLVLYGLSILVVAGVERGRKAPLEPTK